MGRKALSYGKMEEAYAYISRRKKGEREIPELVGKRGRRLMVTGKSEDLCRMCAEAGESRLIVTSGGVLISAFGGGVTSLSATGMGEEKSTQTHFRTFDSAKKERKIYEAILEGGR